MISKPTGLYPDNEAISFGNSLNNDTNLFTSNNSTYYAEILADGTISTTPERHGGYTGDYVTDFIPVTPGTNYKISGYASHLASIGLYNAWYESDGTPISAFIRNGNDAPSVTAPSNAAYLRITYFKYNRTNEEKSIVIKEVPRYEDGLSLSCQILSNSEIETFTYDGIERACAMLILWDKDIYYHFYFGEGSYDSYAPRVIYGDYSIEIKFELSQSVNYVGTYYKNLNTGGVARRSTTLSSILRSGKSYSWKIRLYEKGSFSSTNYIPYERIGYGTISDVTSMPASSKDSTTAGYYFSIFPHMNIYDDIVDMGNDYVAVTDTDGDMSVEPYIRETIYNSLKNIDSHIKYWMDTNGYILRLDKYRFYPPRYYNYDPNASSYNGTNSNGLDFSNDFDSYGNPLAGYAVFDNNSLSSASNILNEFEGETYNIRTNYVDSNWGYFTLCDSPTITVRDDSGNIIEDGKILSLTHSSIALSISYSKPQGVGINYWSYKIYYYDEKNEDYILDYYSGNLYNQDLNLSYDRLFTDRLYKVYISLVDNNQRAFERTVYYETNFPKTDSALFVDIKYYRPHGSVIIDWSNNNSIMPSKSVNIDGCEYVTVQDTSASGYSIVDDVITSNVDKCLYVPSDSSITYTQNDLGVPLNFSNSRITVCFYGTDLTNGTLFEFGSEDGFHVRVDYLNNQLLRIVSNNYCYVYSLYKTYKTSDIITELERNSSVGHSNAPIIWDDNFTWEDSYYWNEHNNISSHWQITISSTTVELSGLSEYCELYGRMSFGNRLSKSTSSFLKLNGDMIYDYIKVENNTETLFECDFNEKMNGANVSTDLTNLAGWRVYKTLGDADKLYEVANLTSTDSCIIEDFAVGDNCKYIYYIYPIIMKDGHKTISTPIVSEPIEFDEGVDKVFGLKQIGDKVYEVVFDQVWRLFLNLEDTGYTYNTDKNFYDTFNRYNQETVGNRKYITKSVSGMLGYIDCSSSDEGIIDTYDMLVSWNEFSGSANLKCLVDARGLILPGNFEANPTVEYENIKGAPATAKFNWRQTSDLDIIKIYATVLPFNPTRGTYVKSSDNHYLLSSEPNILYTSK